MKTFSLQLQALLCFCSMNELGNMKKTASFLYTDIGNSASYGPNLAIDGKLHDSARSSGFFHTPDSASQNEWLEIDMGKEYTLYKVELHFRTGYTEEVDFYAKMREGIVVNVGNVPASSDLAGNPVCATLTSLPDAQETTLIACSKPLTGLYILIQKNNKSQIQLDEVSAFTC